MNDAQKAEHERRVYREQHARLRAQEARMARNGRRNNVLLAIALVVMAALLIWDVWRYIQH